MAQLLTEHDAHPDDVEIELVEVDQAVQEVGLILPPGVQSVAEMQVNIERRLIWLPEDEPETEYVVCL
ncbi:hypothetical protein IQ266_17865 [filamentous cyanobacterium LEGE 11480]|uniref:Uncharacterized protein n=1 Tax=Romeriopsis navalis LEGE 11480 TaxID=2777977 RepID=A0A928VN10_9CYAN|nr:hypothetical protein [Romeriopsis navalis]MBE9031603.1 hypothetical protein [Romeriopsis navalis LEGE 11480]